MSEKPYPSVKAALSSAFGDPRAIPGSVMGGTGAKEFGRLTSMEKIAQDAMVKSAIRRELSLRSYTILEMKYAQQREISQARARVVMLAGEIVETIDTKIPGYFEFVAGRVIEKWAYPKRRVENLTVWAKRIDSSRSTLFRKEQESMKTLDKWESEAVVKARVLMVEKGWI